MSILDWQNVSAQLHQAYHQLQKCEKEWAKERQKEIERQFIDALGTILESINSEIRARVHFQPICREPTNGLHLLHATVTTNKLDLVLPYSIFEAAPEAMPMHIRILAVSILLSFLTRDQHKRVASFNISLADEPRGADVAFSASGDVVLVPDPDFLLSLGYQQTRGMAKESWIPWRDRANRILWRGSSTGIPRLGVSSSGSQWSSRLQRTEACFRVNSSIYSEYCDVGITGLTQVDDPIFISKIKNNIMKEFVDKREQMLFRFHFDIDGNTNSWSGPFQSMLTGVCLLKIGSEHDLKQWYYDERIPWKHYIPIKSDLSDLEEVLGWALSHEDECEVIAAHSFKQAETFTIESELSKVSHRIFERFEARG